MEPKQADFTPIYRTKTLTPEPRPLTPDKNLKSEIKEITYEKMQSIV